MSEGTVAGLALIGLLLAASMIAGLINLAKWLRERIGMVREQKLFTDPRSLQPVYAWTDRHGHPWMARTRWSNRRERVTTRTFQRRECSGSRTP